MLTQPTTTIARPVVIPAPVDFGSPVIIRVVEEEWEEIDVATSNTASPVEITPDMVRERLAGNNDFVAYAVAVVYGNQTADERQRGATRHTNGRGFSGADASYGSYLGRWVTNPPRSAASFEIGGKRYRPLSGKHLGHARRLLAKYVVQIAHTLNGSL